MAGGLLGGGGLRGHGELPHNADINVTSLVDVAFVLLIIFMITAGSRHRAEAGTGRDGGRGRQDLSRSGGAVLR